MSGSYNPSSRYSSTKKKKSAKAKSKPWVNRNRTSPSDFGVGGISAADIMAGKAKRPNPTAPSTASFSPSSSKSKSRSSSSGYPDMSGNITAESMAAHQGRINPDPALAGIDVASKKGSGLVSVDDLLKLADTMISRSTSGGGGSAGAMVDLGAISKQYGDVRGGIDRTVMANLAQLNALKAQAAQSAGAYGQAAEARLRDFGAINDSQGQAAVAAAVAARQAAMRELQGQGVDQSVSAAMGAQSAQAAGDASAAAAAQRQRLANEMLAVKQDKSQRTLDLGASDNDARRVLDQSKLAAILGVNAQEAAALDAARQQNAQVSAANAQRASDTSAGARDAVLKMLEQTGYATPFRNSVETQLSNWSQGDTSWKVMAPQMLRILQGTNDKTDAYNQMMDAIDQYDTDREANSLSLYDRAKWLPQINHMLNRWYSQDTTRVDPEVAKLIMARLSQGL